MIARFLKDRMPRSLYARAALILLVPVMAIFLMVTVASIQRVYEGVSRQMSEGIANEILLIIDRVESAQDAGDALEAALEVAAPLGIEIAAGASNAKTQRSFIDLSGKTVIATLEAAVPGLLAVDLSSRPGYAQLSIETDKGALRLDILRRRLTPRNPHQFLVLIGVTAVLMSAIALIYLRNQVRPIRRLALAAEAFGKGRVVPYRPSGATEVRSAGTAFLDMRDRIERQIDQRTMMLSGVSHDLRTPLTRMKLGLSLMEEGEDTEAMRRDVEDMERMLEAFLAFARGDAREEPRRTDPIDLVRDLVQRSARTQPVQLGALRGEGTLVLRPDSIKRALDNLISNGIRYGHEARVSAEITEKAVTFVVEDSGPGIPPEQRDYVLKAFTRLDAARNQDNGTGVGLGLTIAADIVRQHGGVFNLGESSDLGGLRAEITIPR